MRFSAVRRPASPTGSASRFSRFAAHHGSRFAANERFLRDLRLFFSSFRKNRRYIFSFYNFKTICEFSHLFYETMIIIV
jgi:hypothetical protein